VFALIFCQRFSQSFPTFAVARRRSFGKDIAGVVSILRLLFQERKRSVKPVKGLHYKEVIFVDGRG
jgi:hypothetical protein